MFTALHKDENKPADGWTIAPRKFFKRIFLGSVAFYFLPGLLFPALSYFNVITWFAPKSVVVANLFGISSGLGLFPVTFDWAQIAYIGSPLITPFWAAMNILGGLVMVMWIAAPIMCKYFQEIMITYANRYRLQERPLLFVHAHPLICRMGQSWKAVRRQQDFDRELPLRRRSLQTIQSCLSSDYLRIELRPAICRSYCSAFAHWAMVRKGYLEAMASLLG